MMVGIAADGLEFIGQGLHRLNAARRKNQIVTILGQFTRQIGAYAAGGAGNQSDGASVAFHDNGSDLNKPVEATGIPEFARPAIFTSTSSGAPDALCDGETGWSSFGVVVGATFPEEALRIRSVAEGPVPGRRRHRLLQRMEVGI